MNISQFMSLAGRIAAFCAVAAVLVSLAGCNTMAGLGEDIQAGGSAMENTARDVQDGN